MPHRNMHVTLFAAELIQRATHKHFNSVYDTQASLPAHGVEKGKASFNVALELVHPFRSDEHRHASKVLPARIAIVQKVRSQEEADRAKIVAGRHVGMYDVHKETQEIIVAFGFGK